MFFRSEDNHEVIDINQLMAEIGETVEKIDALRISNDAIINGIEG